MRVKVGDKWYQAEKGQPIMIVMTDGDRSNIERMPAELTRYACFDNVEEKKAWMWAESD